jgi:hypothetical protein
MRGRYNRRMVESVVENIAIYSPFWVAFAFTIYAVYRQRTGIWFWFSAAVAEMVALSVAWFVTVAQVMANWPIQD